MKTTLPFIQALFFITLIGCQQNQSTAQIKTNTDYEMYCAGCHGKQLQQFKLLKTYLKDNATISNVIENGKLNVGMPAFQSILSEDQIQRLVSYIKSFDYEENYIDSNEENKQYEIEVVVNDIGIPWGMEFLPNGDLLIAEKQGKLSRFNASNGLTEIRGLPKVRDEAQGGLMDILLHPDYANNGWIYISYSYFDNPSSDKSNTMIIRAKIVNDQLSNIETIHKGVPATKKTRHYGSRMVFDNEGYLYFSIGDRTNRDAYPQSLSNSNGKIHRVLANGEIPNDNPYRSTDNSIPSIYSYGHRNPQGLAIHPITGEIWEHEHGPKGGDEINIIEKGLNYGWPTISYGINYNGTSFTDLTEKKGMEQPVHYYVPSIAPCGMTFVTTTKYPGWENNLLIGSLKFRYLERIELNGNKIIYQEKLLEELGSRVRNVKVSPDGFIYVAVEGPGRILKLLPKG